MSMSKHAKFHIFVFGLALFLTGIITWPLAANLTTYFPDQGDFNLGVSVLWYNTNSILNGRIFNQQEYFHGFQFYPQPFSLAFANNMVSPTLIFAPLYLLTKNIVASSNIFAFLTVALSFVTAFYTIRYFLSKLTPEVSHFRGVNLASFIGAAIFAFSPVTMSRFPDHLDILNKYFLPLVFLFAFRFLEKPNFSRAFFFFLFFTLNALAVNYYQIFSIILLPVAAIPFLWFYLRKGDWGYFVRLGRASLAGFVFLPILLYFNLPYLRFAQLEDASRPLEASSYFSARIIDYFAPSKDSFLYGWWVKAIDPYRTPKDETLGIFNNYEEHSLGVNLLPLALFVCSFLFLKETPYFKKAKRIPFLYFLLISSLILSLGPYFTGVSSDDNYFPLPYLVLYKLLPFLEGIRVPARLAFVFMVPFSVFCSLGVMYVASRFKKYTNVVSIFILGFIVLENFTLKDFSTRSQVLAKVNTIGIENLSNLAGEAALHFPVYSAFTGPEFGKTSGYINFAIATNGKLVNGNTSYLPPDQLYFLDQAGQDMGLSSFARLKALGVRFVVIHKDALSGSQVKLYEKNNSLYRQITVLDQEGIQILDLNQLNANLPLCVFERDFEVHELLTSGVGFDSPEVLIRNKGNCFLPNIYEDRYREINGVRFKLPILIEPGQEFYSSMSEN